MSEENPKTPGSLNSSSYMIIGAVVVAIAVGFIFASSHKGAGGKHAPAKPAETSASAKPGMAAKPSAAKPKAQQPVKPVPAEVASTEKMPSASLSALNASGKSAAEAPDNSYGYAAPALIDKEFHNKDGSLKLASEKKPNDFEIQKTDGKVFVIGFVSAGEGFMSTYALYPSPTETNKRGIAVPIDAATRIRAISTPGGGSVLHVICRKVYSDPSVHN